MYNLFYLKGKKTLPQIYEKIIWINNLFPIFFWYYNIMKEKLFYTLKTDSLVNIEVGDQCKVNIILLVKKISYQENMFVLK